MKLKDIYGKNISPKTHNISVETRKGTELVTGFGAYKYDLEMGSGWSKRTGAFHAHTNVNVELK